MFKSELSYLEHRPILKGRNNFLIKATAIFLGLKPQLELYNGMTEVEIMQLLQQESQRSWYEDL